MQLATPRLQKRGLRGVSFRLFASLQHRALGVENGVSVRLELVETLADKSQSLKSKRKVQLFDARQRIFLDALVDVLRKMQMMLYELTN